MNVSIGIDIGGTKCALSVGACTCSPSVSEPEGADSRGRMP